MRRSIISLILLSLFFTCGFRLLLWMDVCTLLQANMLYTAALETFFMVGVASFCGLFGGGALGLYLFHKGPLGLDPSPFVHGVLGSFVSATRSIPYIIFMVLLIPLTRIITGSSIGMVAAAFPLSLGAILLFSRLAEDTFSTISKGLIEAGRVMGATKGHILLRIVVFESMPQLIAHFTNLIVMLIGFSAMAGAIGGGGLGDLAIRYGYQRYDLLFLSLVVVVLIFLVHIVQGLGDIFVRFLRRV